MFINKNYFFIPLTTQQHKEFRNVFYFLRYKVTCITIKVVPLTSKLTKFTLRTDKAQKKYVKKFI